MSEYNIIVRDPLQTLMDDVYRSLCGIAVVAKSDDFQGVKVIPLESLAYVSKPMITDIENTFLDRDTPISIFSVNGFFKYVTFDSNKEHWLFLEFSVPANIATSGYGDMAQVQRKIQDVLLAVAEAVNGSVVLGAPTQHNAIVGLQIPFDGYLYEQTDTGKEFRDRLQMFIAMIGGEQSGDVL